MNIVTRDSELAGEHRLFGKRGYDKILFNPFFVLKREKVVEITFIVYKTIRV